MAVVHHFDARRWPRLRFMLGVSQMTGAATGVMLLVTAGLVPVTLYAVALTSLLSVVSILLFGGRRARG